MGVAMAGGVVALADPAAASSEDADAHSQRPDDASPARAEQGAAPPGDASLIIGPPDPGNPCRPQC
jgi:hypothetical protein